MRYVYEIVETLTRLVAVEAPSEPDAYRKVKRLYRKEKIVLYPENCLDTEIKLHEGEGDLSGIPLIEEHPELYR
ncbi:MAG: DpnD/PcfM family protein [Prevotellaceae bacterium]|nr:DpnD/PcfM family protein [Prevotellaceae bacterium]